MNNFLNDLKILLLSTIYDFDETEEQLDTLNKFIPNCLETNASLKKVRFPSPRQQ